MSELRQRFDKRQVARHFSAAACGYDEHAVLQTRVAEELLSRLELVDIQPGRILDLGAGTGYAARRLRARYGRSRLLLLDIAHGMLQQARRAQPRWFSRQSLCCGDAEALPVTGGGMDLVFSNMTLQWCGDVDAVLRECRRVLSSRGLLCFSTLGPDTLGELRSSWAQVDDLDHVSPFMDMHDIGDALLRCGFREPVVDVERYTLTYPDVMALLRDLQGLGASNAVAGRRRSLTGKGALRRMIQAYEGYRHQGLIPASYEVVYAQAWCGPVAEGSRAAGGEVRIPVETLRHRGRS